MSSIDDEEVYSDKNGRYQSMEFLVHGYVDYSIFNISILPIDKTGLAFSVRAPSISPELEKNKWGGESSGNDFVWDRTWKTPKQFKVWWQRIVDEKAWDLATSYDRYTHKESNPGSAWCEAVITIDRPLPKEPGYFILHFYPDGHVEAYISALKEVEEKKPRVEYKDRLKLPV